MYSVNDTRCRVGCPIRISTDQRLLAAPRGFSQRATSFIASWCQGIHRMPFLYSICPEPWPKPKPSPCTETILRPGLRSRPRMILEICVFRTQHDLLEQQANRSLPQPAANRFDNIVHRASEPSPPTVGALSLQITFPVRQFGRTTEPLIHPKTDRESHAPRNAPEPDSHFKRTTRPPKRP
jgi:hypothetical protein